MTGSAADRGRATRQRLLDAAIPLVGEIGWNSVTTRRVAERAGVNPGLVHYHFASVSDLLVVACVDFARGVLQQMARRLVSHATVPDGVDWLLSELTGYPPEDPTFGTLAEAFLNSARLPDLRAQLAGLVTDFRSQVAAWLHEHGTPHADAGATLLAASIDGLLLHRALNPDLDIPAVAPALRRMLAAEHRTITEEGQR